MSCTKIIEVTLATCIFFVQAVHAEMEESLHEKDELKLRLHSYISEVARVEKLIATKARTYPFAPVFYVCDFTHIIITWKPLQKPSSDSSVDPQEQENRDLLERFRLSHMEMEERNQKLQQAEGLSNSIRLELLSSDTERRHLRDAVGQQEKEIQQVRCGTGKRLQRHF